MSYYQRKFILWVFLPVAVAFCGCGRSTSIFPEAHAADTPSGINVADSTGRFIAGLPGAPGTPFASLEQSDAWKEHHLRLDDAWRKADAGLIKGIRDFQSQELKGVPALNAPVFYPFGGPDALVATLYFPASPLYVMVGLEPAGTLPDAARLEKRTDLPAYLADVRETMASELGRSFFITHEMDREFRGQVTDGLSLPILHLLVRTGHSIVGFRYVRIDEDGQVIERAANYVAPGKIGNKGIEIEFVTDSDSSKHKLYYFSVNLSDARLRENKPFLAYLSRLNGPTTLLKATSYMTHRPDFSIIRDFVLANSSAILQDDSGIPYRWFRPDVWNVQLYGDYTRPYGSFRWLEQSDLRKAYGEPGPRPLPMRIGYGYSRIPSNLLLARRAGSGAAAHVQAAR